MKKLNYATLAETGYDGYILKDAPEKVIQFGEGNFMRAFVDYWFDLMNEKAGFNGKVVLVQPIAPGLAKMINEQEGLYTLFLRGFENGQKVNAKRVISSVSRCLNPYEDYQAVLDCAKNPDLRFISCNTTEAGIAYDPECKFEDVPASSYPGKLTQFLYERFKHFGKEKGKGFIILSCELIDNNGKELEKCVLQYVDQWNLGEEFKTWVKEENTFCSTLVDRIVTGYPRNEAAQICEELGYEDNLIDTGEVFGFWVIEGPQSIKKELPVEEAGLPILICDDHKLLAISLNSTSKWKARVMPSLKGYVEKYGKVPACIAASLAFYIEFYRGTKLEDGHFTGVRNAAGKNNEYEIKDDLPILKFYDAHKNDSADVLAKEVLSNTDFWGEDLTAVPGLLDAVTEAMKLSETEGTYAVMQKCLKAAE